MVVWPLQAWFKISADGDMYKPTHISVPAFDQTDILMHINQSRIGKIYHPNISRYFENIVQELLNMGSP